MDSVLTHEEVSELLGAYALDAVGPEEASAIARHVAECRRCAAELESFHEVAGMLGNAGGEAPPHLWERLADEINRAGHPGDGDDRVVELLGGRVARTTPTRAQRARRANVRRGREGRWPAGARWAASGIAAAVLAVIVLLGYEVAHLDTRVNNLESAGAATSVVEAAQQAMLDPAAREVVLAADDSPATTAMELVILPSGTSYAINSRLPELPSSQTYQLWGWVGSRIVSLGLLGNHPADVALQLDPSTIDKYAVTAEPAGGVVQPTVPPAAASRATA